MKIYKVLFWLCTITIITLSSIPSLSLPISDKLSPDKIAHCLEYTAFSFLYFKFKSVGNTNIETIIKHLWIMVAIIPILDETHQLFIPGRDFSVFDILADSIGFISVILYLYYKKRKLLNAKTI